MNGIKIIKEPITRAELKKIAEERFGDLVKAAVDIEQGIMAVGGELHVDEQVALVEEAGSKHWDVWGVNIKPLETGDDFIHFDSVINYKVNYGNRTRDIDNLEIKEKVMDIINKLVK